MRRPLLYISVIFLVGIVSAHYFMPVLLLSVYIVLLFIAIRRKEKIVIALVLVAILGSLHLSLMDFRLNVDESLCGRVIEIQGLVTASVDKEKYTQLTVKTKNTKRYLVYVNGKAKEEYLGKTVVLKGKFSLPDGRRNPGLFDYKLYLKTKKIVGSISTSESNIVKTDRKNVSISLPGKVKGEVVKSQEKYMKEEAVTLLKGILFGDKTQIDDDVYESFQKNGTAHILSVSGIHLSIIYGYISIAFKNKRSRLGAAFVILFLLFYCALAEFSPSVIRAAFMIVINVVSKHLHRRYDFPSAIGFSALVILIYNPYYVFNLGFQLTYTAVLSLAFALPHFDQWENPVVKIMAPIICIQFAMAPLTAFHFMYFSLSAFILNIPVVFLAGLAVPLGISLAVLSFLPSTILTAVLLESGYLVLEKILDFMTWINFLATKTGFSHMNVRAPSIFFLAIFYGFFFYISSESFMILMQQRRKELAKTIAFGLVMVSIVTSLAISDVYGRPDLVFVDVGQGDCLHIRTATGKNILIDGGGQRDLDVGKKILKPYLLKNGVKKIDLALVTHLHHDHYHGIASLSKEFPVLKIGVYEANCLKLEELQDDTGLRAEDFIFLREGNLIKIDENTAIHVVYPKKKTLEEYKKLIGDDEDENFNSLVFLVEHKGKKILMTGDLGFPGEGELLAQGRDLQADILKVGHHGSRFSTGDEFLKLIGPRIAVIQVGRNNYGHPHSDIIDKLEKKSIMIYRNDLHGAILVKIKNSTMKIVTML